MDTIAERWRRLAPDVEHLTPTGAGPFPTVLMFHGCGGVRRHLRSYARAAVRVGWGVLLVDSFEPRGWSKRLAQFLVCTGVRFRGRERAGDVLAAVWGAQAWPGVVPSQLVVAGWSHGAWAIMDLWTMPLTQTGEAGLSDAPKARLDGVRAAFLAYPYVGFASASKGRRWPRALSILSVVPQRDHLATVKRHMQALTSAVRAGSDVAVWSVDATHAFDEPGLNSGLMRYDRALSLEARERFQRFLTTLAA